jgi:hypothetical protein
MRIALLWSPAYPKLPKEGHMRFKFEVEVEVERESGKFVSRDEIAEQLQEAIEGSDPGEAYVDDSVYAVTDWSVGEAVEEKAAKR